MSNSKSAIRNLQLEPEQTAAAFEINRHISVTAGPGSGKTTVLVERYLHILRESEPSIDQIVAITFTNRAANEMRERLRGRLNQILQTAAGNDRRRWLDYKRTLDGAVITTIHGFCARLLREFPVEAGVDPQFLLLDEHRAAMLLESVVEETLSKFISSGHVEISRLTLGVGRSKLAAALAGIYRDLRGQGLALTDLALKSAGSHATEKDYELAVAELTRTMNDFLRAPRRTPSSRANQEQVIASWADLRSVVHFIPAAEAVADYCRAVEGFRGLRPQARGAVIEQVKALDELLWEKELLGRVPQICLDLFARQYALEMINLVGCIDERLNEEKQKLSALDFDDLELRALALLERPEVLTRAAERYKFFLVDEFQDTNGLQRQLLERLALPENRRKSANLFIVGDRKQSIYGFRGADVDVFREMTARMISAGGEAKSLQLNFRSQPPLIHFFNYFFKRLFEPKEEITPREREELGYVEHETSEAKREPQAPGPLVELMITTTSSAEEVDDKAEQTSREIDAGQLALRINSLTSIRGADSIQYSDIALLFRAMTQVHSYESVFRRANIPYQTVLGRGFYEREEVTDLIQLLRFLDNKTDELALAAVLRSPLCGLSDNALLALSCAPLLAEVDTGDGLRHFTQTRKLFQALRRHREIAFIDDAEHELLDRSLDLIKRLNARRHQYSMGELLRFAVEQSEYLQVVAANFDGAQRLANVERLFTLAERFNRSGTHLIRDFVRYVEEFEAIGSRESEGQIDEAANAVRLMTIHQAKGLEFPVVIIPDLQRLSKSPENWILLDRHRGLTLKVPDGRGKLVAGCTFNSFEQRQYWREQFESMRLLYVAATRARDHLIFSGTTSDLDSLSGKSDTWLKWVWQSLELANKSRSGIVELADEVQIQLTINASQQAQKKVDTVSVASPELIDDPRPLHTVFPLLPSLESERARAFHRFSVTQLINFQRCSRQYYFDRVLHVPSADEIAVWNDAEAPEPPANLTATFKGAIVHRFCETYCAGDDTLQRLRQSFAQVLRLRQAELADRLPDIDEERALQELLPLAENYLSSDVFERIELARKASKATVATMPSDEAGLWSELSFRVRRPLGLLSGVIDKLLITRLPEDHRFEIEIIDFKTNRLGDSSVLRKRISARTAEAEASRPIAAAAVQTSGKMRPRRTSQHFAPHQFAFEFSEGVASGSIDGAKVVATEEDNSNGSPAEDAVRLVAADYRLQMQAYALAVRELLPSLVREGRIKVTLHFLEPNVEYHLADHLLAPEACSDAIDNCMLQLVSSLAPEHFPVRPGGHCRMCNFLSLCDAGRRYIQ